MFTCNVEALQRSTPTYDKGLGSLSGVTPANSVCLRIMSSVRQGANAVKEDRRLIIVRNRTCEVWGRKNDEGGVVGYSSGNGPEYFSFVHVPVTSTMAVRKRIYEITCYHQA